MGNKKSIFLSALVGALTGCMITMMAIPYILQHSGIGRGNFRADETDAEGRQCAKTYLCTNFYG